MSWGGSSSLIRILLRVPFMASRFLSGRGRRWIICFIPVASLSLRCSFPPILLPFSFFPLYLSSIRLDRAAQHHHNPPLPSILYKASLLPLFLLPFSSSLSHPHTYTHTHVLNKQTTNIKMGKQTSPKPQGYTGGGSGCVVQRSAATGAGSSAADAAPAMSNGGRGAGGGSCSIQ